MNPKPSVSPKKGRNTAILGLSLALFLVLNGILLLPWTGEKRLHESSWTVTADTGSGTMEIPYHRPVRETETIILESFLDYEPGEALCFFNLDVTALSAELDGAPLYSAGDHSEPTANLWNSMIVFPLPDTPPGEGHLVIRATGNQIISLDHLPFYLPRNHACRLSALHHILHNDLLLFLMGASCIVGILLVSFAGRMGSGLFSSDRTGGLLMGVSCILAAVYALDFTYRISTGSYLHYAVIKRVIVAAGYLASFTYTAGLEYHRRRKWSVSKWAAIPTAAIIIAVFAAPTLGVLHRWFPVLNAVLLVNLILVVTVILRGQRTEPFFLFAAGLIVLGLAQIIAVMAFDLPIPVVIQYVVVIVSIPFGLQFMVDQRQVAEERDDLKMAYDRDPLTDAHNRRALENADLRAYSAAVFIDLDAFKKFNDTYGHEKGDELLISFVAMSRSLLRKDDVVVRYGGDEFLILFTESDGKAARGAVERIRRNLRESVEDGDLDLSYGIEEIGDDGVLDLEDLDEKMYAMKLNKRRG